MTKKDYWELFLQTGAPEFYLKYQQAMRMEDPNVSDNTGPGTTGHGLQ